MAEHDLAYDGFVDYVRRTIRVGETYAEIADRCKHHAEPFWTPEVSSNLRWGMMLLVLFVLLFIAPGILWWAVIAFIGILIGRKTLQTQRRTEDWEVAFIYALHTYSAKLAIAVGIIRWRMTRA